MLGPGPNKDGAVEEEVVRTESTATLLVVMMVSSTRATLGYYRMHAPEEVGSPGDQLGLRPAPAL